MPLKPCRECGQEVAKSAPTCPKCGVKHPGRGVLDMQFSGLRGCAVILTVTLVVVIVFGSISTTPSGTTSPRPSTSRRGPGVLYHATRNVNVREGPGTNAAVAYTLNAGDRSYIGHRNGDGWAAVYGGPGTADTVGFVFASLLTAGHPPDLLLMEYEWRNPRANEYWPHIVGSVKNISGRAMRYVEIRWTLLDAQDRHIGVAWTNSTDLRDGDVWRFETLVGEEGVAKFRLESLSGR